MRESINSVAKLAQSWLERCGLSLEHRSSLCALDAAIGARGVTAEQRLLRAAACDLIDTLSTTSEGRQILRDLGFHPLSQNAKGE